MNQRKLNNLIGLIDGYDIKILFFSPSSLNISKNVTFYGRTQRGGVLI